MIPSLAVIIDPNSENFKLGESSAIISYLIDTYDDSQALTYDESRKDFRLQQWSGFQATHQSLCFALAAGYAPLDLHKLS